MANTARLVIDPITRKISTKYEKIRLVQNDNNSTCVTFEMPRYVRGHDMSKCSTVEVHYDNISVDRKQVNSDVYFVSDITVAPEDEETINFSWLVSRNATQIVGSVEFSLHFGCEEDPTLEYAWHTTTYSGINVFAGKHNTEAVVENCPDALTGILGDIKKLNDTIYGDGDLPEDAQSGSLAYRVGELEKGKLDKTSIAPDLSGNDPDKAPSVAAVNEGLAAFTSIETVRGEAVKLEGVSPLQHDLSVKLSSDDVTDFSSTTLYAYGKNFVDYTNHKVTSAGAATFNGREITLTRATEAGNPPSIIFYLGNYEDFIGKTITLSAVTVGFVNNTTASTSVMIGDVTATDIKSVTSLAHSTSTIGTKVSNKGIVTKVDGFEGRPLTIRHYLGSGKTKGDAFTVKDLQVEIGETATEYEEYKAPVEYTPNADGTVNGIELLQPTTTLMTATQGVTIEAEYNKTLKAELSAKLDAPTTYKATAILGIGSSVNPTTGKYPTVTFDTHGIGTTTYVARFASVSAESTWKNKEPKYTLGGADPLYPIQYANKRYVDNCLATKIDKPTTEYNTEALLARDGSGNYAWYRTSQNEPTAKRIPRLTDDATIRTNAPKNDLDAANKKYVVDNFASKKEVDLLRKAINEGALGNIYQPVVDTEPSWSATVGKHLPEGIMPIAVVNKLVANFNYESYTEDVFKGYQPVFENDASEVNTYGWVAKLNIPYTANTYEIYAARQFDEVEDEEGNVMHPPLTDSPVIRIPFAPITIPASGRSCRIKITPLSQDTFEGSCHLEFLDSFGYRIESISLEYASLDGSGGYDSGLFDIYDATIASILFVGGWECSFKNHIFTVSIEVDGQRIVSYPIPKIISTTGMEDGMVQIDEIVIPSNIQELDGYGLMYSETQYNYLDFDNRTFVRVCKKEGDKVVLLDNPETVDVSAYLSEDAGDITVAPSGVICTDMSAQPDTPVQIMLHMTYLEKL